MMPRLIDSLFRVHAEEAIRRSRQTRVRGGAWDTSRVAVGFASFNNYLVPPIALVYGYFILGEQPHLNALVALALILFGLALPRIVTARRRPPS